MSTNTVPALFLILHTSQVSLSNFPGCVNDGRICASVNPFDQRGIGADAYQVFVLNRPQFRRETAQAGVGACYKQACLEGQISSINSSATQYGWPGPNSNTSLRTMLDKCSIPRDSISGGLLAVGLVGFDYPDVE